MLARWPKRVNIYIHTLLVVMGPFYAAGLLLFPARRRHVDDNIIIPPILPHQPIIVVARETDKFLK